MSVNMNDPGQLNGTTVVGGDGEKLGNVDAVYYDNATDRAEWVAVRDLDGVVLDMLDRMLATVPPAVWERRSCAVGTKCARYYDWVAVAVAVAVEGRAT